METLEDIQRQMEFIQAALKANQNQLDLVKPYAASEAKVEVEQPNRRNKVAACHNLFSMLTGSGQKMNDDVQSGTDSLRYFAGASSRSEYDKAIAEKVRKSFDLMRLFGGR